MVSGPYGTVNFSATNFSDNMIIPNPIIGRTPLSENKHRSLIDWRISGVSSKLKVSELMPLLVSFPTSGVYFFTTGKASSSSCF
ncbi:hypothetical protein AYI68_g6911 [Smittium mucronatum]|uniref:Uncharacterized protein n=1 Tax=Smittium mucronatum TaxID=133383 RepID=A0A1R0GQ56_9FUNG|nr:hypothetical protein AYI68_g6911 [Smittium mucronatum]